MHDEMAGGEGRDQQNWREVFEGMKYSESDGCQLKNVDLKIVNRD